MLVQCLREAVLFAPGSETSGDSKRPTSVTNDTSDKNSDKEGVVLVLSQRIKDFTKCLELLDQHVGMLILRQRKGSLVSTSAIYLPSPPLLFLTSFLSFFPFFFPLSLFLLPSSCPYRVPLPALAIPFSVSPTAEFSWRCSPQRSQSSLELPQWWRD